MQRSTQDLATALEASRASLADAIAGLDEEGFRRRAASGQWTAAEIVAHLLSNEERLLELAGMAVTQDNPVVPSRGQGAHDEGAKTAQRMLVPQIWHGALARRRETLRFVAGLSDAQLDRTLRHERFGQVSVRWLLEKLTAHEQEHADEIRALRRQLAGAAT